jgi:exoribonuclease R
MQRDSGRHQHDLRAIARRVMVERDLLPDFSSAVMPEVARSQAAPANGAPKMRDLRGLLWCSIDNDDSPDLDQLTFAEPIGGGVVRILVAVADADATVAQGSATEAEDRANKVERQVGKSAAALLLEPRIGQQFDAIITGASQKGTWVRILRPPVEGKLVQGADGLDVGDQLQVTLIATDVEQGYIDFSRVGGSPTMGLRSPATR